MASARVVASAQTTAAARQPERDAAEGCGRPQGPAPLLPGEGGQRDDPDDQGQQGQRDEGVGVRQRQAGKAEGEQHGGAPAVRAPHEGHDSRQQCGEERLPEKVGPQHAVPEEPVGERREGDAGQRGGDGDRDAGTQHPPRQQHQPHRPDEAGADQGRRRDARDHRRAAELRHRGSDAMEGGGVETGAALGRVARGVQGRDVALLEHPARGAEVEHGVRVLGEVVGRAGEGHEHHGHGRQRKRGADQHRPEGVGRFGGPQAADQTGQPGEDPESGHHEGEGADTPADPGQGGGDAPEGDGGHRQGGAHPQRRGGPAPQQQRGHDAGHEQHEDGDGDGR